MKFVCDRNQLTVAVGSISRIAASRSTMPILGCVLIKADANGITLNATNVTMAASLRLPGTVQEDGSAAVEAKLLADVAQRLPDGVVQMATDGQRLLVKSGSVRLKLGILDPKTFPEFPAKPDTEGCAMDAASLREAIRKVAFATQPNDSNVMLSAIHLVIDNGWMTLTALDGHRIAEWSVPAEADGNMDIIVPCADIGEACRVFNETEITLQTDENGIFLSTEDAKVRLGRIAGNYFDINRMVTANYPIAMEVKREELIGALERAMLFDRGNDRKPVVLEAVNDTLKVSFESPFGSSEEELALHKEGDDLKIGFNPKFLLDALRAIPDETVRMQMSNSISPVLMEDEERTYRHMVLPLRF